MAIYLDHNATTPVDPEVLEAMLPYYQSAFGNPSSVHGFGQAARRGLDRAREQVAALIGCSPSELVFTAGGTEADNLAVKGVLGVAANPLAHIVTSATEHPAILASCADAQTRGIEITYVGSDEQGQVQPAAIAAAISQQTVLVTVMTANNDIGIVAPIREISQIAHDREILVHSDAVQALGKIAVDVRASGVDLLSISSHKIYGPKGVGALFVRAGTRLLSQMSGGHQEGRHRGGTENVPGIVGFGKACELATRRLAEEAQRIAALRDALEAGILERVPNIKINGKDTPRLPGTSSICFPGAEGDALMMALDLLGIAVSTGAACHAQSREPSHVLMAMGRSTWDARSVLRFSLGRGNTQTEVDIAIQAVAATVARLRSCSPIPTQG